MTLTHTNQLNLTKLNQLETRNFAVDCQLRTQRQTGVKAVTD